MTSLKTSIKTITNLSDTNCLEVHGASLIVTTTTVKVRGYHLDIYQHVDNACYLEFLEEARWAWFE